MSVEPGQETETGLEQGSVAAKSDPEPTTADADANPNKIPPWVKRAIVMWWLILVGLWLLLSLARQLDSLLTQIVLALFFSFAMEPVVDRLAARGINRGLATGMTMLGVVGFFAAFVAAMGSLIANQLFELSEELPTHVTRAELWAERRFDIELENSDVLEQFQSGGQANEIITDAANRLVGATSFVLEIIFQLLTISLFAFYLTAEGPRARRTLCSILPPARQFEVLRVWELAISKTGAFLVSRVILGLVSGLVHWTVFAALGMPSAVALGLWVGLISQFIPVVGIYIAGVVPTLIALGIDPTKALWVLIAITIYQQIENYVLQPRVTAHTLNMHPAVAFAAVLAGTSIFGFTGAILALPALATGQAFISAYIARHDVIDSHLLDSVMPEMKRHQ